MKRIVCHALFLILSSSGMVSSQAAFSSFYVFGDGLSTTTSNTVSYPTSTNYYEHRYSNGRVWVEVLAQQQGLPYYASNNLSYFGNTSSDMVTEVNHFNPPADASNALVVVWVNNADLFYPAYYGYTASQWTNVINQSQTNYFKAITNLYAKGIRSLVLPNVVDLSRIPAFNTSAYTNTIHQQCVAYNVAFNATLNRVRTNANYAGLAIYAPDTFAVLANMLADPAYYGLTNALKNGLSIDALSVLANKSLTGPGTNFIFWDYADPTAQAHYWVASIVQQLVSPVKIGHLTAFSGSNQLNIVNVPVGQNGMVLACTNLASGSWKTTVTIDSTNTSQSVSVPASGPQQFYKLSFPVVWSWP